MGNILTYSGLVTKVRAMQAKLLTKADAENIISLRSVPDIVAYLAEKPAYHEILSDLNEDMIHRGNIEKILIQSFYNDYARLYRFAGMNQKQFLKLYLKRHEVEVINYCLRIVFNHYDAPFDLDYKKPFFDSFSQLSIDRLITSKNIDELVDNLKDTEYYAPLKMLRDSNAATLFDYDLALDLYTFSAVWKKRKKVLKNKELEIFTRDCGSSIDLMNMQWIYRAKKYYDMLPPDIYSLLIPINYRIKPDLFRELVEAPSSNEFSSIAKRTPYARKYDFDQGHTLERMYAECMYRLHVSDRRSNPHSIAVVNTYLFMKELEIKELTTVLECVRYNLSPEETVRHLGGVIK